MSGYHSSSSEHTCKLGMTRNEAQSLGINLDLYDLLLSRPTQDLIARHAALDQQKRHALPVPDVAAETSSNSPTVECLSDLSGLSELHDLRERIAIRSLLAGRMTAGDMEATLYLLHWATH